MDNKTAKDLVMDESFFARSTTLKEESIADLVRCGVIREQGARENLLSIHDGTLDLSAVEVASLAGITHRQVKRLADDGKYEGARKGKSTSIRDGQKGWVIPLVSAIKVHDLSQSAVLGFFIARSRGVNQ